MNGDYLTVRARVKPRHLSRIEELCHTTGLSVSELVRSLIENAQVIQRPVLGATLGVSENENTRTKVLADCMGDGKIDGKKCPTCRGSGQVPW